MKQLFLTLSVAFLSVAAFAQKKLNDVVKFNTVSVDQGKVKQNAADEVTFILTNISSEPIIIEAATPGCGCTTPNYTKEPIMPGKTGTVTAKYNAANVGPYNKSVTVKFSGVDDTQTLTLTGEVLAANEVVTPAPATQIVAAAPAVPAAAKTTAKKVVKKAKTKASK
jgi:hypothetical protein